MGIEFDFGKEGKLSREEEMKRNIINYSDYSSELLYVGRQAGQKYRTCSPKLTFRAGLQDEENDFRTLRISPELYVVWEKIKKESHPEACVEITKDILDKECQEVKVEQLMEALKEEQKKNSGLIGGEYQYLWYGTTMNGIELHPGLIGKEKPDALLLGDDCVHGLLAGRTGSGKSVALHTLITGLMMEYAPWELNINLADFKIIELSKYGNPSYPAPHVDKIAATGSMEYVLSVMYDMYEKMEIRQKVFASLGLQKLSDYRKKFDVVLPREILIVDEFQQMYELATLKQRDKINTLIKMITKLGRATGYHLLFASQSMQGTVGRDVLSNFKLRMCLSADEDVSNAVLGNKAASQLNAEKAKGYLIANSEGGNVSFNIEFQVPLVKEPEDASEGSDVNNVLQLCHNVSSKVGFVKDLDFFKEDVCRRLYGEKDSLEGDLLKFTENARRVVGKEKETDFYLLLGDSLVYAKNVYKKTALEYLPVKYGDKKHIVCIGDSAAQRAYMVSLLSMQFERWRICGEDKLGTDENYIINSDIVTGQMIQRKDMFLNVTLPKMNAFIEKKCCPYMILWKYYQLSEKEQTQENLIEIVRNDEYMKKELSVQYAVLGKGSEKEEFYSFFIKGFVENLYKKYIAPLGTSLNVKRLPRITFWINGFQMMQDQTKSWNRNLGDILRMGSNIGIRFVFIGNSLNDFDFNFCVGYYFFMTNDDMNYTKARMQKGVGIRDNVLNIKAVNETLNRQKPSLYILNQDEKLVKTCEMDEGENMDNLEKELFSGI